jgi:hypothetical protein
MCQFGAALFVRRSTMFRRRSCRRQNNCVIVEASNEGSGKNSQSAAKAVGDNRLVMLTVFDISRNGTEIGNKKRVTLKETRREIPRPTSWA